ncbi:MAG TPA: acetolactate synthase small subunit [Polyangia bacterium]
MTATALNLPASIAPPVHTISILVRNKPGVLVRVALVFSRRGYNIESLVVSPDVADGEFSRMSITCSGELETLEQIIKQCTKLIDVVHAIDHTGKAVIETEIALVKVTCPLDRRTEILQIAEQYNGKIVDYGTDSLIVRMYGSSDKLDAFISLMRQFEITELVRSGKILMARGNETT